MSSYKLKHYGPVQSFNTVAFKTFATFLHPSTNRCSAPLNLWAVSLTGMSFYAQNSSPTFLTDLYKRTYCMLLNVLPFVSCRFMAA